MTTKSNRPRDFLHIPLPIFDYAKQGVEARYRIRMVYWKEGSPEPLPKTFESITANEFLAGQLRGPFSDTGLCKQIIVGVEKLD